MNKKIFVTGGAGYIGTSLIPLLLDQGHSVTVYDSLMFRNGDNLSPFFRDANFSFVKGDILDPDRLRKAMEGHHVIIHLAALAGFPICRDLGQEISHQINVLGTQNVIDCMDKDQNL